MNFSLNLKVGLLDSHFLIWTGLNSIRAKNNFGQKKRILKVLQISHHYNCLILKSKNDHSLQNVMNNNALKFAKNNFDECISNLSQKKILCFLP